MTNIRLGLAQIYPELGAIETNIARHCTWLERARAQSLDLLIFPELSLSGYQLRDLVTEVAIPTNAGDHRFLSLLETTKVTGVDALVGYVQRDERHRYYTAAAYCNAGQVLHNHRKLYLPTYTLFDEARFLSAGSNLRAFDTRFGRFGILICEDAWHISPPYLLWLDGAEIILLQCASPSRGISEEEQFANARWLERVAQAYACLFTVYVVCVNRVGYEDGLHFGGGSFVVDPEGQIISRADDFSEELLAVDLDLRQLQRLRARLPLLRDERTDWFQAQLRRLLESDER